MAVNGKMEGIQLAPLCDKVRHQLVILSAIGMSVKTLRPIGCTHELSAD
jgi:hypothetical protein